MSSSTLPRQLDMLSLALLSNAHASAQPDDRIFGELTLSRICDDPHSSAAAYTRNCEASDVAYLLVYDDQGVSLGRAPQLVPASLVRLDALPTLTGLGMVDIISAYDDSNPSGCFFSSG